jgi:hypothetical protein
MEIKNEEGVVIQRGNVVLRVSAGLAANQVAKGYAKYTSKQKLKSVIKRANQVESNLAWLRDSGFKIDKGAIFATKSGKKVGTIYKDPSSGKIYAHINYHNYYIRPINLGYEQRVLPIDYENS